MGGGNNSVDRLAVAEPEKKPQAHATLTRKKPNKNTSGKYGFQHCNHAPVYLPGGERGKTFAGGWVENFQRWAGGQGPNLLPLRGRLIAQNEQKRLKNGRRKSRVSGAGGVSRSGGFGPPLEEA